MNITYQNFELKSNLWYDISTILFYTLEKLEILAI